MKLFLALLSPLLLACSAHADLNGDFQSRARSELIKPFARDLGGLLGAASADPGWRLGFPGFSAGALGALQVRPDKDDLILRDSGVGAFGVPLLEAAIGLPKGLALVAHGISYSGASILGGGLRYNVLKAPVVGGLLPTLGVGLFGDRVHAGAFSGQHYALNAAVGWKLPLLAPFIDAGLDLTRVRADAADAAGVSGQSAWAQGSRLGAGLELTPLPFLRLRAAYQLIHGIGGMTLGLLAVFG
ncbi:MAG: hypothetical protein KGK30_03545 [Elusimicrobia bacterium]|nr:hypothetical protein [Elusimicrobiota bacterium]